MVIEISFSIKLVNEWSIMYEKNILQMYDFFKISEEDFKLRGSGDLFGTKQSGDMSFKLANLKQDYNLLINAKTDTEEFLKNKNPEDIELKLRLIKMVNYNS